MDASYLAVGIALIGAGFLLMLAELDRIIDNDRTRRYVERFKSPNKEVIEYPKAHHTLEFEPEPDFFIDDLLRWLDTVVCQPARH